jgi:Protein of unknown function (DUF2911)
LGVGSCPPPLVASNAGDELWQGLAEARGHSRRAKAGALGAVVVSVALMSTATLLAQEQPKGPKPSQHGTVSQRVNETTITVVYNRPTARGRELFGKLVPYGRIWCPCADDATTVEVSTGVKIDGQELPAGKYSLWTEPQADRWTVIFNKNHAVWHTRYPEGQDALRLQITPRAGSHMESLAFYFPAVDGRKAELVLHWGTVIVPMGIEVP